jgi:8-oxo-dGTP pyrophosphatase MutT (NUDIX family)
MSIELAARLKYDRAVATTAIVSEILIAGLAALVWISMLLLTIFGTGWVDTSALDGWEALTTIFVLAAAYVLGIFIDRAADSGEKLLEVWWPEAEVAKPGVGAMRMAVYGQGGDAAKFVEYQRSRLRVARSATLNLLIALPVTTVFLAVRTNLGAQVAIVALLLAVAVLLAHVAYRRIQVAYLKGLSNAYGEVTGRTVEVEVAAAVPYRRKERLEFLLVRTKGGRAPKRWTFPKGHRKTQKDRSLAETAKREAREEAGIDGTVDDEELGTFPYPGDDGDDVVHAYLFRVEREGLPVKGKERRREPTWNAPEQARRLIAEGDREPNYARGMQAILEAAVRKLGAGVSSA